MAPVLSDGRSLSCSHGRVSNTIPLAKPNLLQEQRCSSSSVTRCPVASDTETNALGSSLAANSLLVDLPVIMLWKTDHYQLAVSVPVDATGILAARDDAEDFSVAAASDLQGVVATGFVSGANTVTIRLTNPTSGALDHPSTTLVVRVRPRY